MKYHALFVFFLKKAEKLKLSSAAKSGSVVQDEMSFKESFYC